MKSIHTEIGIGAPAWQVWDVFAAIDQLPEWNPFAKAMKRALKTRVEAGRGPA